MDFQLLFPGKYLKSAEFKGLDVTLTIKTIDLRELETNQGKKTKPVISFVETKKEWVLNRTNAECLKGMWKGETNAWINKRVTLFPAPYTDSMSGEVGTAIRVRGSPDLDGNKSIEVNLPRRKPIPMTMYKTDPRTQKFKAAPSTNSAPSEPPPESFDHDDVLPPEFQ